MHLIPEHFRSFQKRAWKWVILQSLTKPPPLGSTPDTPMLLGSRKGSPNLVGRRIFCFRDVVMLDVFSLVKIFDLRPLSFGCFLSAFSPSHLPDLILEFTLVFCSISCFPAYLYVSTLEYFHTKREVKFCQEDHISQWESLRWYLRVNSSSAIHHLHAHANGLSLGLLIGCFPGTLTRS